MDEVLNLDNTNKDKSKMQKIANNLLSRRDYSVFEMQTKLREKGFAERDISEFIAYLQETNLLNDARFASSFIRYQYSRGKGENWIKQALHQKGISDAKLALAFSEEKSQLDWQSRILELIAKRNPDLNDVKQKAKLQRWLASRGFAYQQIQTAINIFADTKTE